MQFDATNVAQRPFRGVPRPNWRAVALVGMLVAAVAWAFA